MLDYSPISIINEHPTDANKIKYTIQIIYKDESLSTHSILTTVTVDSPGGLDLIYKYCFENKLLGIYDVL